MKSTEKKASWLELFYDIAFIALVAQLTYLSYAHHQTLLDFVNIFLVAYVIFIAWWATTANRNLKPTETTTDKLLIQAQMVGAFLMSITMPDIFEGQYTGFFFTFGLLRLLQAGTVWGMYIKHPETKPQTNNILQGFFVAAGLWICAAFVPFPYTYPLAFSALLVDIMTPLTTGKGNATRYLSVKHLQERLGLFLMLVIGESMIVVALSNTAADLSIAEPTIVFAGLGMMIALWWLYFEYSDQRQGIRPKNLFLYIHAHAFLFGSIILLSVGYKLAIEQTQTFVAGWFVTAGAVGVLLTLTIIRLMLHSRVKKTFLRSGVYLLVGVGMATAALLTSTAQTLIVLMTLLFMGAAVVDSNFRSSPLSAKPGRAEDYPGLQDM